MKQYEDPVINIIILDVKDIIITSNEGKQDIPTDNEGKWDFTTD